MSAEALRSRIGSALANRDYADLEAAWREYAGLHPEEHAYLVHVAGQLARYDKGALGGELCLGLAETLLESGEVKPAFDTAKAALRLSQRPEGLRDLLRKVYKARYDDRGDLETFLQKSGLAGEEGGLRQEVDTLDRYLTFREGAYVYHRGGWGYGQVTEFDADEEEMEVDFEKKKGHRLNLLSATKILECLPDEHFGVYQHYRRDELHKLFSEDPVEIFRIFLESHGRSAPLKQVREAIVPDLLTREEWSRFWSKAKKALLKHPEFRVGKGSSPLLDLRDQAKAIEDEVAERMEARNTGLERAGVAREYLRTLDLTPALAASIGEKVETSLQEVTQSPSSRLALLLLKSDLGGDEAKVAEQQAAELAVQANDLVAVLAPLEAADRKRVLQMLAEIGPENWAEQLVRLLRSGDAEVADLALDLLHKRRPDLLIQLFTDLQSNPRGNPELFLWYAKGVLAGSIPQDLVPGETHSNAMEKLLTLTNQVGLEQKRSGDPELKEFLRHVRSFLTSRRMKLFSQFSAEVPLDYARFLHSKVFRNRGLTDQTKQALIDVLEAEHPKIHVTAEAEAEEAAIPEDVLFTTMKGYHRKEAELRQILEVEVPQNAEDLGRAASFGDISENAEYSAALEKQGFLMRRVQELRSEIERARIIDPTEVRSDCVWIGTRVRLRNKSRDLEERFTILGPWDVNLDRGVISYLSPVGKGLLGKRPGAEAEIELPEGSVSYEVLDVELAPDLAEAED